MKGHRADPEHALWTVAVESARGNITRAARSLGISGRLGMLLTRRYGLNDRARVWGGAGGMGAGGGRGW